MDRIATWPARDRADLMREAGAMKRMPPEHVMKAVVRDYDGMRLMIYGERPDFDEIMTGLKALETKINAL
ncbi:MAG: hypothetical protein WCS52_04630 [bacterium]